VLDGVLKASSVEYYAILPVLKRKKRGTQRVLGRARARCRRGADAVPTRCGHARVWQRFVPSAGCRACFGAGITWTSRTTSAGWAAREGHTSVIDAAGAIYVIGGIGGGTDLNDVWASTDGGADRTRSKGRSGGYSRGYYRVLRGTKGY
jgi:hypothetical protein